MTMSMSSVILTLGNESESALHIFLEAVVKYRILIFENKQYDLGFNTIGWRTRQL